MDCNKVQYSKREAHEAIKFLPTVGKQYRKEKRAYHCPNCNHWHITSKDAGRNKTIEIKLRYKAQWDSLLGK